jgi:NMD protein affecting ribosome stability and mRNA decay
MSSNKKCVFCGTSTAEFPAVDSAQVRCNVREFGDETFTVWRCARCGSLHATEPIDPDRYYQPYINHPLPYCVWSVERRQNDAAALTLTKMLT